MMEERNKEIEQKRSIENYQERNKENLVYRDMLIKEGILGEKEYMGKSDFNRVREIAYNQRVKSEEDARNLAMLEFSLNKKVVEGEKAMGIYKEIGEEFSELVSKLFTDKTQKGNKEVCSMIARSTLEQFVRSFLDGVPELFIDILLKNIEERERVAATLPKAVSLDHDTRTATVNVVVKSTK